MATELLHMSGTLSKIAPKHKVLNCTKQKGNFRYTGVFCAHVWLNSIFVNGDTKRDEKEDEKWRKWANITAF